ncbi:2672_t:CDS:2, partial [Racocetra fulgida]
MFISSSSTSPTTLSPLSPYLQIGSSTQSQPPARSTSPLLQSLSPSVQQMKPQSSSPQLQPMKTQSSSPQLQPMKTQSSSPQLQPMKPQSSSPQLQPMKSILSSQQTKTQSLANPGTPIQLRPTSPLQHSKTLSMSSPQLSSSRPLSPTQKSTRPISPSSRPQTPQPTKYQSFHPPAISPPHTPPQSPRMQVHSAHSLSHQRSLTSVQQTQSRSMSPQPREEQNYLSPTPELFTFPSPSPPRSPKIQVYPPSVVSTININRASPENSSPILEPFNLKQNHLFTLVSRTDLALISGWIDGLDLSSPDDAAYAVTDDDEILENNLACKYNISNRNLIIHTTPLKHKSMFMKEGEVKCKPHCYSLDLLEKIDGVMDLYDNEYVKTYKIEEYE